MLANTMKNNESRARLHTRYKNAFRDMEETL